MGCMLMYHSAEMAQCSSPSEAKSLFNRLCPLRGSKSLSLHSVRTYIKVSALHENVSKFACLEVLSSTIKPYEMYVFKYPMHLEHETIDEFKDRQQKVDKDVEFSDAITLSNSGLPVEGFVEYRSFSFPSFRYRSYVGSLSKHYQYSLDTTALSEAMLLDALDQFNLALIRLHGLGFVHGDIKPSNMFHLHGVFHLGDFGGSGPKNSDLTLISGNFLPKDLLDAGKLTRQCDLACLCCSFLSMMGKLDVHYESIAALQGAVESLGVSILPTKLLNVCFL